MMRLGQLYAGVLTYRSHYFDEGHKLLVAVPCFVEGVRGELHGLLDTAAEWCVLPVSAAVELGLPVSDPPDVFLHTRLGTFGGSTERVPVRFRADEGEDIVVEATCFVSPDWTGPFVLGWRGCLERMRFALDPNEERFYFAEFGDPDV
jgi:hypothetical protein